MDINPHDDKQNYPFCRTINWSLVRNQIIKIQELLSQRYYKTLGTSVINSSAPPPFDYKLIHNPNDDINKMPLL